MKTSGLGLSIAVLAFGASTIYLAVQLSEERAHSEQLADATRALNARIVELEKARDGIPLAVNGTFGSVNLPPSGTLNAQLPPPPAASAAQSGARAAAATNQTIFAPQGQAFERMMRAQIRAQNKQLYADVGAQLGLTREDVNKLIDLITDQQTGGLGIPREVTDPAERQRLLEEAMRENKTKIERLLGPEKLQSFEEYQQSIPARQELNVLVRQLEGSDAAPLSSDQRKRLLAALMEERKRIPLPQFSPGVDHADFSKTYSDWQADYNARVAAQARNILNSEQYAAYDDYREWQQEMNAQLSRARIQGGADGNVMFTATAPGVIVGETVDIVSTDSDEKTEK
jgi:hypothetical protein